MPIVLALGGNALLRRGEPLSAEAQQRNMRAAAAPLARACEGRQTAIVHGNGPQVGLLALETAAYEAAPPTPLDVLGAESQGMIGYLIARELRNAAPQQATAALLTQTVVSADDPAFESPTKPIGPVYAASEAPQLRARGWSLAADGAGVRRTVPSPAPLEVVELPIIAQMLAAGVTVICAGGGGVPVRRTPQGALVGVEAVIDKDLTAALLALRLEAERLVILTDVDGVYLDWGAPGARRLDEVSVQELRSLTFAPGSMGPKVAAACRFAEATGRAAFIGALAEAEAVIAGRAGTRVRP